MAKHRRALGVLIVALTLWALGAAAEEQKPPRNLAELQQRLMEIISQPKYAAAIWGLKVVSLDSGKKLFEYNAEKLFSPASNSKLYTVALALNRLGAEYRIKTSLYSKVKPERSGTLRDDLVVYGRGDPTVCARLHEGDIFHALEPLVQALTNAGVKRIKGDLVGDESFIRGPEFGSGWAWDDMEYDYGAEISALTIDENTTQVKIKPGDRPGSKCVVTPAPGINYLVFSNRTETVGPGQKRTTRFYRPPGQNVVYVFGQMATDDAEYTEPVPYHNPARMFVALFKEALARHGIKVSGRLRIVDWLQRQVEPLDYVKMNELGSIESLAMRDIVHEVQKASRNLYTDLLLAHVGETSRTRSNSLEETSEELGIRALNGFLAQAGVKEGEVRFEEGSGLSRDNLTTPNATVTLLQYMSQHDCAQAYAEALPIAGVDGTLRNRMKGTAAEGNVHAKTGSLRWAKSLSGYVTTAAGEHLAFSLMVNRFENPNGSATTDLDSIAALLASFAGRTGN